MYLYFRWICEKYDGVRTIWHAEEREFYSRWGSILPLPFYIKDTFSSDVWLDGEISLLYWIILFAYFFSIYSFYGSILFECYYIWFGKERGMRYQAIKISQVCSAKIH